MSELLLLLSGKRDQTNRRRSSCWSCWKMDIEREREREREKAAHLSTESDEKNTPMESRAILEPEAIEGEESKLVGVRKAQPWHGGVRRRPLVVLRHRLPESRPQAKSLTRERDDYRPRRSPSCRVTARLPVTHTLR